MSSSYHRPSEAGVDDHTTGISGDEEDAPRPIFRRFAYVPERPSARRTCRPPEDKIRVAGAARKPVVSRRSRPIWSDMFSGFDHKRLSYLSSCVCCLRRWTVVKSPAEKALHHFQCAIRNHLSPATVLDLLEKELAYASRPDISSGRDPSRLESIVSQSLSRRHRRHPLAAATIQEPALTTNDILDRARAIIHSKVSASSSSILRPSPSMVFPESTPPFTASALAGQSRGLFFIGGEGSSPP